VIAQFRNGCWLAASVPERFGEAGGVKAIKGDIGAIPAFAGIVVFSPQRPGSKEDARASF
jgi:hypothetical protein